MTYQRTEIGIVPEWNESPRALQEYKEMFWALAAEVNLEVSKEDKAGLDEILEAAYNNGYSPKEALEVVLENS